MGDHDVNRDYILTRSGIRFYPLEPRAEDIVIGDVAFALSNICRYGGHVDFLSVAEHSILVSEAVQQVAQGWPRKSALRATLFGLLHDAAEAYPPGDILGPMKKLPAFASVVAVQERIENCCEQAFGLDELSDQERTVVRAADKWMLCREVRWLKRPCHVEELERLAELKSYLVAEYGFTESTDAPPLHPGAARTAFLLRYEAITKALARPTGATGEA